MFVLSPDAVASDVALKEVAHAASLNKRFAPIVCRRVEDGAVPEALRRLNFIFFDDPAGFEASADCGDVEPSQMKIGLLLNEPLDAEEIERIGGPQPLREVEFEGLPEDGGGWYIVVTYPGGMQEHIPGFQSEAEAEQWLSGKGRLTWLKARGYAQ